jgi:hypothetical protein
MELSYIASSSRTSTFELHLWPPVGLLQRPLVELEPMRASMEGVRRRRRI